MSWNSVLLTDVCRPRQWKTISTAELSESGFPVYGANGQIGYYHEYSHEAPTIMITCRGATCGNVHISAPRSYINGNAMALDSLDSQVNLRYLYYYLSSYDFKSVISGSAQPQITGQGLSNIKIPLPPLHMQQQIADTLDKADALRRKDQELLQKYDELAEAIFYDMFGDPVENNKNWKEVKLAEITKKITDGEHLSPKITTTGIPMVTAKNVQADGIDFSNGIQFIDQHDHIKFNKKCNPEIGDLLVVSRGATIGRSCIVDINRPFSLMGSVILIKCGERITSSYLRTLFTLPEYRRKLFTVSSASAQQAIYISHLGNLNVPNPPLPIQQKFSIALKKITTLKDNVRTSFHNSNKLFDSSIENYFR